jgi:hypothetical protein
MNAAYVPLTPTQIYSNILGAFLPAFLSLLNILASFIIKGSIKGDEQKNIKMLKIGLAPKNRDKLLKMLYI